jgi:NADPH:quinone reductase-like Zn-dependent oxidoreductase
VLGEPAGAKERGVVVHALLTQRSSRMLADYSAAVAQRKLEIPISRKMPLAQAADAQKFAERQHPNGKVLLLG